MGVRRTCGVVLALCVVGDAAANTVDLDNGVGFGIPGRVRVTTDEFGSYGLGISPGNEDSFQPAGENFIGVTWLSGAFVFVRTPDLKTSAALLNADAKWLKVVEPAEGNTADGLAGDHALVRTITEQIVKTGSTAHSAFTISDPAALTLAFDLAQTVTYDNPTGTTEFLQTYAISNTGPTSLDVVFHVEWDAQLIWNDGFEFNIVGVGQGLCYLYMTDMQGGDHAVAMADGGSSVPLTSYYGAKAELTPEAGPPVYAASDDKVFVNFGTPTSWQNRIANVAGQFVAGNSGPTPGKDATMGLEWRFAIAAGAQQTIKVRRIYGTSVLLCPGGASCGDGVLDSGEQCDDGEADTAACNAVSCTAALCGDGYVNEMAGEACEPGGVGIESATCNNDCTTALCGDGKVNAAAGEACDEAGDTDTCNANCQPAMCGDGYVNAAAAEDCEDGELCDLATCSYNFELGGGCAGCATKRPDVSWIVAVLALGSLIRRRRYN